MKAIVLAMATAIISLATLAPDALAKRRGGSGWSSPSPSSSPSPGSPATSVPSVPRSQSSAGPANASPGRALPIIIPIPGLARVSNATIVKVLDLPDTPELSRSNGVETVYVDLGYKFSNNGDADEWVGHIGSRSSYLQLTGKELDLLMKVGGLSELPPVPQRPQSQPASAAGQGPSLIGTVLSVLLSPVVMILGMMYVVWRMFRRPQTA